MVKYKLYDETDPKSIEKYGKKMIGKTLGEILNSNNEIVSEDFAIYNNAKHKGKVGHLIEKEYFGIERNSKQEPDFKEANVELKVSPYEFKRDKTLRAVERMVLSMIPFDKPINTNLYDSHFWHKCRLLLLVYYLKDRTLKSNMDTLISFVSLFTPDQTDMKIIEEDYKKIATKIIEGRANELSESDTMYLGACTKGMNAEKAIAKQYYYPYTIAKRRAFCFKNSYMTFVLNKYLNKEVIEADSIIKNASLLQNTSLENYVIDKIKTFVGMTDEKIASLFEIPYSKDNKSQWRVIANRMLGVKTEEAQEFLKANVVVRTLRVGKNGKIKEHIPLPPLNFSSLLNEEWEDSELFSYLDETKFLFVVFKETEAGTVLKGAQFWNIPSSDLENVYKCWEQTRKVVRKGLIIEKSGSGDNIKFKNNLPGSKENLVAHVRPHAQKRYYDLLDGYIYGENESDSDLLPDGRRITKQSFWLNNSYILNQLKEELK